MDNPNKILLAEVESFLGETGMPWSVFGHKAVGDRGFVRGLREGREPRFKTIHKVKDFIAQAQKERA